MRANQLRISRPLNILASVWRQANIHFAGFAELPHHVRGGISIPPTCVQYYVDDAILTLRKQRTMHAMNSRRIYIRQRARARFVYV